MLIIPRMADVKAYLAASLSRVFGSRPLPAALAFAWVRQREAGSKFQAARGTIQRGDWECGRRQDL